VKNYKYLYVNGCSFTAGHRLLPEETWPVKLADKLGIQLYMEAKNGQSFTSIYRSTISALSLLNPKETCVVIGMTFAPRYAVNFGRGMVSITPSDVIMKKDFIQDDYLAKIGYDKRLATTYSLTSHDKDIKEISSMDSIGANVKRKNQTLYDDIHSEMKTNLNYLNKVCHSFAKYYYNLIKYDSNLLDNQIISLLCELLGLQGYLKEHGFQYRFVEWDSIFNWYDLVKIYPYIEDISWYHLYDKLDLSNIVKFLYEDKIHIKQHESHPTAKGCDYITERVYDSFNR